MTKTLREKKRPASVLALCYFGVGREGWIASLSVHRGLSAFCSVQTERSESAAGETACSICGLNKILDSGVGVRDRFVDEYQNLRMATALKLAVGVPHMLK